jgi:hypothetical protein
VDPKFGQLEILDSAGRITTRFTKEHRDPAGHIVLSGPYVGLAVSGSCLNACVCSQFVVIDCSKSLAASASHTLDSPAA